MFTEINSELRGHRFYPTAAELKKLPRESAQGGVGDDAIVRIHYFCAAGDWWISKVADDFDETGLVYGYARLAAFPAGAEWGYISLIELEELMVKRSGRMPVYVERDCYWTPKTLRECLDR